MSAVQKAIDEIHFRIPKQILELAFITRHQSIWNKISTPAASIDSQILTSVIRPRVLTDCNLVGGTQSLIPLNALSQQSPDGVSCVIKIPKKLTNGRSINSVLHVAFLNSASLAQNAAGVGGSTGIVQNYGGSATMTAASAVMASYDNIPVISTARVELISENVILIKDQIVLAANAFLRCIIANQENLENLQMRSYRHFAQLVNYAVKAYIYNTLIITLDQAALQTGMALGAVKEQIEKYADADQLYLDYLNDNMEAILFFNDAASADRYTRLLVGGNR